MDPFTMVGSMAAIALAVKVARARRKYLEAKKEVEAAEAEERGATPGAVAGDLPPKEARARHFALSTLEESYRSDEHKNMGYEQSMRVALRNAYKVYKDQGGKLAYTETQNTFYNAKNPIPPHLRKPRPGFELIAWPTVEALFLEE